jgi:hypothetical protein
VHRHARELIAATILIVLFIYRPATTWPGLAMVLRSNDATSQEVKWVLSDCTGSLTGSTTRAA